MTNGWNKHAWRFTVLETMKLQISKIHLDKHTFGKHLNKNRFGDWLFWNNASKCIAILHTIIWNQYDGTEIHCQSCHKIELNTMQSHFQHFINLLSQERNFQITSAISISQRDNRRLCPTTNILHRLATKWKSEIQFDKTASVQPAPDRRRTPDPPTTFSVRCFSVND